MTGRTHLLVGEATALWVLQPKEPKVIATIVAGAAIGSLIADTDIPSSTASKASRKVIIGFILMMLLLVFLDSLIGGKIMDQLQSFSRSQVVLRLLTFMVFLVFSTTRPHREFTHSFIAVIIASYCLSGIFYALENAVFVGYLSHLIIDYPNKKGEALLWPYPKRFCLNLCSADGLAASVLCYASIGVILLYPIYLVLRL